MTQRLLRRKLHFRIANALLPLFGATLLSIIVPPQEANATPLATIAGPLRPIESPIPPCSDDAWRSPEVKLLLAPALRRAEINAKTEVPAWDSAAYAEFSRNGQRAVGEQMIRRRLEPLTTLVLAECMENKGRLVPAVEQVLDALSLQPSWTLPADDPDLANLHGHYSVDLNACETAHDAAWALRLMSPRLDPAVRTRLINALNERIFNPLRDTIERRRQGAPLGPHWWIEGKSNWNAVCVSGVVGAAYAMGREDINYWLAFGRDASRHYLESFNDDGYSDEGPSYWNYGFGAYLRLRETLQWAEPRGSDLLSAPKARAMAAYPAKISMPGDSVAPFGDAPNMARIDAVTKAHAEVAIGWTTPAKWAALAHPTSSGGRLNEALWRLWGHPAAAPGNSPLTFNESCSLFPTSEVAVFRPQNTDSPTGSLSVTLRTGGSKHHAHDDAGSYAIDIDGVIATGDPGSPVYTKDTFGPLRRKDPFVNSYGHPVPLVNGNIQLDATLHQARWAVKPCSPATAQVQEAAIDLTPVYDVSDLQMLRRDLSYDGQAGRFVVFTDRFNSKRPISFETAIVTRGTVTRTNDSLVIEQGSERLAVDIKATSPFDIKLDTFEDQPTNRATRIALRMRNPASNGCIAYRFRHPDDDKTPSAFGDCASK
ncbi:hypothetical protein FVF58_23110 [Paraburkholderia panacisoli]|uniref:Heparinase II/III-like protein n=1 Tax=Paraburkholderia panacisoli TaxID=2603818 RepID=A0A5B0GZ51_9BURK|nr:hypothetical protein [Paraburkholderia panacisoli]KAA1008227.1 hypothetical protein FVF58_23110 [Paraburkholderia panacisoli]